MKDSAAPTRLAPPSPAEITQIEAHVQVRLNKRVRDFQLVTHGRGLVLRGYAATYYAKQLAQQAVLEATTFPILANEIHVG
jgi:hypothetical protein